MLWIQCVAVGGTHGSAQAFGELIIPGAMASDAQRKPFVYLLVILPILAGGGVCFVAALLEAYSHLKGVARSAPNKTAPANRRPISASKPFPGAKPASFRPSSKDSVQTRQRNLKLPTPASTIQPSHQAGQPEKRRRGQSSICPTLRRSNVPTLLSQSMILLITPELC